MVKKTRSVVRSARHREISVSRARAQQVSSMSEQPRRPVFFWLVLLVCGLYAGLFAFMIYADVRYYGFEKAPGWSVRPDRTGWVVAYVDDAGPAAGRIELGDRLLAINGDQRRAVFGTFAWSFVDGGKTYRVDLDRRGERVSLELPLLLVPGQQLTPIFGLVGLAFFICGAALALLRPRDPQVRLAGIFLMSAGFSSLSWALVSTSAFLAAGLSLLQPLPCLEKSGTGVADHTVAAVCVVRADDVARIDDYVRGPRRLGRRHAISGRPSLALPDHPPGYGSPAVCLHDCLLYACVRCGSAQLQAPARSRQPTANSVGHRGSDNCRSPVPGSAIRG